VGFVFYPLVSFAYFLEEVARFMGHFHERFKSLQTTVFRFVSGVQSCFPPLRDVGINCNHWLFGRRSPFSPRRVGFDRRLEDLAMV